MSKLDNLIHEFNKQYKDEIASVGILKLHANKIPLSSPKMNYMIYGGLAQGRLIEFAGLEGSGKTTTALDAVSNAQKLFKKEWKTEIAELEKKSKTYKTELAKLQYLKERGPKRCVYADCENTLDETWAEMLGVDISEMILLKPQTQTAEQIFEMILQLIETDEVGLIVIDSLGVMLSSQAYEKTMEERTYGGISMALTLFSKKAANLCAKNKCTLIGINQMRADLNSTYNKLNTTGGHAWRHNCSLRIMFNQGPFIDDNNKELTRRAETPYGNIVEASIIKTKVCRPDRRIGSYTLKYTTGIDVLADTLDIAIYYNIIKRAGAWYYLINDETGEVIQKADGTDYKFNGSSNLQKFYQENPKQFEVLYRQIEEIIKN